MTESLDLQFLRHYKKLPYSKTNIWHTLIYYIVKIMQESTWHDCQTHPEADHVRLCLKCDGTHAETRFHLSAKRTSPFNSAGASVQSTTGSLGVRISGSNAGYAMFWGSVKSTGYPLHSPVSPSLHLPRVSVCHHISTGLY
jgi:hypothetical protein